MYLVKLENVVGQLKIFLAEVENTLHAGVGVGPLFWYQRHYPECDNSKT